MSVDPFTPEKRSAIMRAVKARDTAPELAVRRALMAEGRRYRLQAADLPGKPDIVFRGAKRAIFVHGCFWHGHDCARGARAPKTNSGYWQGKIARNRARDAASQTALRAAGWRTLTIWECETRDASELRARLSEFLSAPA